MKDVKDDTNRWKAIPSSWIGRINTVTMHIPPKAIYRLNVTPIKLQMAFSPELEFFFKFVWKHKRSRIAKATLRKKNGVGGIRLLDIRQ